jgi:precorrin-6Y C5,15-methyltransferase (decarboxylating)
MSRRAVTVVGIGADGCVGLSSRAVNAVARAQVLVGGQRQLDFFPQFSGTRLALRGGLDGVLDRVAALAEEQNVCILASGDPLFFGIGSRVIERLGAAHVEVIPQPSSVQLAFARAGLSWDDATCLSLHGRPLEGLLTRLRRLSKVAILTDPENTPARIAAHLLDHGQSGWHGWLCENLGGPAERVQQLPLPALAQTCDTAALNLLLLVRSAPDWRPPPLVPFLPEEEFARRMPRQGLITKREVRLLSLAALALREDSVVWDIGAGSGAVAIEAALLAPAGRVYAIECDPEGVALCRDNLRSHGVDNVRVVAGLAPEALADLGDPDAVFVGGSKGSMARILEVALARLRPGGRLVVNAITLENAGEAYQTLRRLGLVPEVTLLQVSRSRPLARYLRYEALNPIQIFAVEKPAGALAGEPTGAEANA